MLRNGEPGLEPGGSAVRHVHRVVQGGVTASAVECVDPVLGHGQNPTGTGLHGDRCEALVGCLAERREARVLLRFAQHVLAEVGGVPGVHAAVERHAAMGLQGCRHGLGVLRLGDVPQLVHPGQYLVPPLRGALDRLRAGGERVVHGGRLDHARERRRLIEGELRGVHVEVVLGGRLDAVGVLPEERDVEVAVEDLVLVLVMVWSRAMAWRISLSLRVRLRAVAASWAATAPAA